MDDKQKRQSIILYVILAIAVVVAVRAFIYPAVTQNQVQPVDYSTFLTMVDDNEVDQVQYNTEADTILFTGKGDKANQTFSTNVFPNDNDLVQRLEDHKVTFTAQLPDAGANMLTYFLMVWGLPLLLIFGGGWLLNRHDLRGRRHRQLRQERS